MAERTRYYKAADVTLAAPYYAGRGDLYLPGTEHTPDRFDPDAAKSCTNGLYYISHRRVAARWGPVVLEVQVLGSQLKTNDRVKPGNQPGAVDATRYNKYRTDRMRILRIVGVTGYSGHLIRAYSRGSLIQDKTERSRNQALENVEQLNIALLRAGYRPVTFLDQSLERLRDDGFRLWGVMDPNAVSVTKTPRPRFYTGKYGVEVSTTENLADLQAAIFEVCKGLDGIDIDTLRVTRTI